MITRIALILMTLLLVSHAHTAEAEEIWIEVYGISRHSADTFVEHGTGVVKPYNEANTGIGVGLPFGKNFELGIGTYKNSYYKQSTYLGFDIHSNSRKLISYGVSIAAVSGYTDTEANTRFMVLPNLMLSTDHFRVKVGMLPSKVSLLTVTIGVRF